MGILAILLLWLVLALAVSLLFWLAEAAGAGAEVGFDPRALTAQALWLVLCVVLAGPILFLLRDTFCEGVVLLVDVVGRPASAFLFHGLEVLDRSIAGSQRGSSFKSVLFAFGVTGFLVILALNALTFGIRTVARSLTAVAVPGAVISAVTLYHADTGPPPLLLDAISLAFFAALLYGLLFPLLWSGVEPILAGRLPSALLQRLRAHIRGIEPRHRQPLFLVLGIVGLASLLARALSSAADSTVATGSWPRPGSSSATGSAAEVRRTVGTWSEASARSFTVPPGEAIATGIILSAQEVFSFRSTGEAELELAPGQRVALPLTEPRGNDTVSCPLPLGDATSRSRCFDYLVASPTGGELKIRSAAPLGAGAITVTVEKPRWRGGTYRWLAAGESLSLPLDQGLFYCAGPGLTAYPPNSNAKPTALRSVLSCDPDPTKTWPRLATGNLQLRAGSSMTWFGGLRPDPHFRSR